MSTGPYQLQRLRTGLLPFRLHYFPRLQSTNDHAARLRRGDKLFAPAAVLAGRQTAGRGRGDNTWWSPPGCITITFVVPTEENLPAQELPLIAGLALRNAAAEVIGDDQSIQLKWPNDLLYRGRKLAGLLCERINGIDLIGIGLNVNVNPAKAPKPLREIITSLSAITGQAKLDPTDVLIRVAGQLHRMLLRRREHSFAGFVAEYSRHHALPGKRVTVIVPHEPAITGRCQGIDDAGRLLVKSGRVLHRIVAGHVVLPTEAG